MQKLANIKDIKLGKSLTFNYKGQKAVLVRAKEASSLTSGELAAYVAVCPHEAGAIVWDEQIRKLCCECHLSLFNVQDGSIYRHSTAFEMNKGLTKIDLKVDKNQDIYAM